MDAAQPSRAQEKQPLLTRLAELMTEEMVEEGLFLETPHYSVIERSAMRLGRELSRQAQERGAREAAAGCAVEAACPACESACRVETKKRKVTSAIARALCSLGRHGQTLQQVEQGDAGCTLTAALPSSLWAMKGEMKVSLQRREGGAQMTAATHIPGQMYDWGKSNRCLENLFTNLQSDMDLPPSEKPRHAA